MFHCIVHHILFIHSPADTHLDCCHCVCETVVSNAALNICVKIFVWTFVFRFFGYTRRYGIAGTRLIGKDSDPGRDWWQEEKGMTEDEMAGWHH